MKLVENIKKYIKDKLNPTYPTFRKLIDASWNTIEDEKLEELGFGHGSLKTESNNKVIEIEKFYDEEVVGYANNVYGVCIYSLDNTYDREHKSFDDFDKFIKHIKDNIPEVDLNVKSYNI